MRRTPDRHLRRLRGRLAFASDRADPARQGDQIAAAINGHQPGGPAKRRTRDPQTQVATIGHMLRMISPGERPATLQSSMSRTAPGDLLWERPVQTRISFNGGT